MAYPTSSSVRWWTAMGQESILIAVASWSVVTLLTGLLGIFSRRSSC